MGTSLARRWFGSLFQRSRAHRHIHSFPTRRSSDLVEVFPSQARGRHSMALVISVDPRDGLEGFVLRDYQRHAVAASDRESTRLNSSHANISYAAFRMTKIRATCRAKSSATVFGIAC